MILYKTVSTVQHFKCQLNLSKESKENLFHQILYCLNLCCNPFGGKCSDGEKNYTKVNSQESN